MIKCQKCRREYSTEIDFLTGTRDWRVVANPGSLSYRCRCGQLMSLKKGELSLYAPDLPFGAGSVFNMLASNKIPRLSTVATGVRAAVADESKSSSQIAELFRREPVLASRVLRLANTFRKTDAPKLTSIEHAISFVGRTAVANMVVITELSSFRLSSSRYSSGDFLAGALAAGVAAEFLSSRLGDGLSSVDEAYLGGALAGVGRLIQGVCFGPGTDKLIGAISSPVAALSWEQAEAAAGLPDSGVLGEIGAAIWGIEGFNGIIFHHGRLAAMRRSGLINPAAKLSLFECVAYGMALAPILLGSPKTASRETVSDLRSRLSLSELEFERLVIALDGEWANKGAALGIASEDGAA